MVLVGYQELQKVIEQEPGSGDVSPELPVPAQNPASLALPAAMWIPTDYEIRGGCSSPLFHPGFPHCPHAMSGFDEASWLGGSRSTLERWCWVVGLEKGLMLRV